VICTLVLLEQLHCSPNASGNIDCWDAAKGGAPAKIEKNLFGGWDVRRDDGTLERCGPKASGEIECRVVTKGRAK